MLKFLVVRTIMNIKRISKEYTQFDINYLVYLKISF